MFSFLRSAALIGAIALNSPVLEQGSGTQPPMPDLSRFLAHLEARAGGSVSAAREAAEILAGLDPDIRERLLDNLFAARPDARTKHAAGGHRP